MDNTEEVPGPAESVTAKSVAVAVEAVAAEPEATSPAEDYAPTVETEQATTEIPSDEEADESKLTWQSFAYLAD